MKLGIAQNMLMLPVCIHSMNVFSCDRLERKREDTAGIPILSQYLAKDFCHFAELLLFAILWTGKGFGSEKPFRPPPHIAIPPQPAEHFYSVSCATQADKEPTPDTQTPSVISKKHGTKSDYYHNDGNSSN